jgi:hypothetical protein
MSRTNEFAKDLCKELNRHKQNGLEWCSAGPKRINAGHESVDATGYGKKDTPLVLVEVELRRDAPALNVVKVWNWIKQRRFTRKLILIQAFSARYSKVNTLRKNSIFIGEQMQAAGAARYISMDFKYKPREYGKTGAGRRCYHATRLGRRIVHGLKARRIA